MAMTALPTFAVPLVWDWMKVPPSVDPHTDAKARSLAEYFERTWVSGDFQPVSGHTMTTSGLALRTSPRVGTTDSTVGWACRTRRCACFSTGSRSTSSRCSVGGCSWKPESRRSRNLRCTRSWAPICGRRRCRSVCSTGAFSATSSRATLPSDYGSSALLPSTIWLE